MATFSLSDAELHGLVDGQIDVQRRADILRRAAGSAADRERIGAWQGQGELIRAAFQGIDREPLPSTLDLRTPVRLHALPSARPVLEPSLDPLPVAAAPERRRARVLAPSLMALVAASGVAATWFAGGFTVAPPRGAAPFSFEEVLARRASGALAAEGTAAAAESPAAPSEVPVAMPTASIPDLTPLGFTLAGAEAQVGEPVSLVFRYRNASAEQIAIGVAQSGEGSERAGQDRLGQDRLDQDRSGPIPAGQAPGRAAPVGDVLVWHAGKRTYALAGTLRPERLRALFASLRDLALEE